MADAIHEELTALARDAVDLEVAGQLLDELRVPVQDAGQPPMLRGSLTGRLIAWAAQWHQGRRSPSCQCAVCQAMRRAQRRYIERSIISE